MKDDPIDEETQRLMELVQMHCRQIGEHVDAVQIFVSLQTPGGENTRTYEYGTGNWYAREGQVRTWLIGQDEITREWARTKQRGED